MRNTYPAPSPDFIQAAHFGGRQVPTLITMHSAVCPCKAGEARAVAAMFAQGDRVASAHYSVDPHEVIQSVRDHRVAYHCGYNQDSLAVEMCELPALTMARWASLRFLHSPRRRMLDRAAELVAELCLAYGIRPVLLNVKATLAWDAAGRPAHLGGINTHNVMTRAFHRSTHWDPGAWPRLRFQRKVRAHMRRLAQAAA